MGEWWLRAESIDAVLGALPERTISAGGTLIKPEIAKEGRTGQFVDISRVGALRSIAERDGALAIGAMVRNQDVVRDATIRARIPALAHAASTIGNPHVRRDGTVGGNVACRLARASLPPVLLALDATVIVRTAQGTRTLDINTVLREGVPAGALITEVVVPIKEGWRIACDKLAWRNATAKAIVTAAVAVRLDGETVAEAHLVAGGLCVAVRLPKAEAALVGKRLDAETVRSVAALAAAEPPYEVTDVPAGETYRRRLVGTTIARLLVPHA